MLFPHFSDYTLLRLKAAGLKCKLTGGTCLHTVSYEVTTLKFPYAQVAEAGGQHCSLLRFSSLASRSQHDKHLLFSRSVVSESLRPQPASLLCPLPLFRQEYWSGSPFPSQGDLPDPGIEPTSPALVGGFFATEPPRQPSFIFVHSTLHSFQC